MPRSKDSSDKKRKASAELTAAAAAPSSTDAAAPALQVHRCRFVDWMPHAIDVLAFNAAGDRLAVARANGDVEVWHVGRKWHLALVFHGSAQRKVSALCWSFASGRLFAASLDGTLWELDFAFVRRKNVMDANGGPVWCMAIDDEAQTLALGCEDGRIRLFAFDEGAIYFRKGFVTTGKRVVSLAWHTKAKKMFSGSEDGVIHCWNSHSGRNEARITLESLAKQKTIVWSLLVLDDLTLVSGDSHGGLSFWHAPTGTLLQKFTHLTADVLALAVDPSNTTLFASGVDNQVVEFRRRGADMTSAGAAATSATAASSANMWAYAYSHRAHSHDVRALALSPNANAPVLVSGGVDTQLVWYRADSFNVHRPFKIASMPYRNTIALANESRVLLVQKSTSLDLWKLAPASASPTPAGMDLATSTPNMLLLELHVSEAFNISCSALAPNASFIACATAKELKLFSLHKQQNKASGELASVTPRKLKLPEAVAGPARVLAFSPDSTRLVIASDAHQIRVLDVEKMEVVKTFRVAASIAASSASPIISLSISQDGQWLATGDADNLISVYNLDSMQFYCHLPRPSEMHTNLGFNPSGKTLVVTLVSNSFVCYDVEKKGLSEWYRQHHEHFPKALVDGRNVKGMAFDPANADMLYLYSQSSLYQINMGKPKQQPHEDATAAAAKKARRSRAMSVGTESDGKNVTEEEQLELEDGFCRVINRYRPLSFVDFVAEGELVIVETPWLKVLSRLPGALHRHKYGK